MKIVRPSLAEDVLERVRRDILTGVLRPDAPIRQDALAAALGVSKIPVREALTRLEQDGFVVSHPRRGFAVRGLSADEAREVFALRLALEPRVAAEGAILASDEDRSAAHASLTALETAVGQLAPEAGALNRAFHAALAAPADRPLTLEIVMRLHLHAERYVNLHLRPAGRAERARAEHVAILDAWCRRDTDAVERSLADHIGGTLADLEREMAALTSEAAEAAAGGR